MKPLSLLALSLVFSTVALAADVTPPTLDITHTWIEKSGSSYKFNLLLDPQDETGIAGYQVRTKLNSTAAIPASVSWSATLPFLRDTPHSDVFSCTAIVYEVRAVDTSGNFSPVQRRTFQSPFPVSLQPSLDPHFAAPLTLTGLSAEDLRGVFVADFDRDTYHTEDIATVDRATGVVTIRLQTIGGITFTNKTLSLASNAIDDAAVADLDADNLPDFVFALSNGITVSRNLGIVSSAFQFSNMMLAALSVTSRVAVGDVNHDGKLDIVFDGTDGSNNPKLGICLGNGDSTFQAATFLDLPSGAAPGVLRVADLTGDSYPEVIVADAANHQLIVFKNDAGALGAIDDADTAKQPQYLPTNTGLPQGQAQSIAVGDVTGDGRPDVVAAIPFHFSNGTNITHTSNFIVYENQGTSGLVAHHFDQIATADLADSTERFTDVVIRDVTGDRFAEMNFTNPFKPGITSVRLVANLDSANHLPSFLTTTKTTVLAASSPLRITDGQIGSGGARSLIVANQSTGQISILHPVIGASSKPNDLIGGASTNSDPNGSLGNNGIYSYTEYLGGTVHYSLTYINNTDSDVTDATIECLLPSNYAFGSIGGSSGITLAASGTSTYVRWTNVLIPAHSADVKNISTLISSGKVGAFIAPTARLKKGTTTLASTTLPKITILEPTKLQMTVETDSNMAPGDTVHADEAITYRLTVTNQANTPITNTKLSISIPSNTTYSAHSSDAAPFGTPAITGTVAKPTSLTWTAATLAGHAVATRFVQVLVNPTVADGTVIKQSTATLTRSDGAKNIAPSFNTTVLSLLEITLTQDKNIARPGDLIDYEFHVKNWSSNAITSAKVVDVIPDGTALVYARADDGSGNFVDVKQLTNTLTLGTNPALDRSVNLLTWSLGNVPAGADRYLRFEAQVQYDVPTYYTTKGVSHAVEASNYSYNFLGTTPSGKRVFAGVPTVGIAAASLANATNFALLSTKLANKRVLFSADDPISPPSIDFLKEAIADDEISENGDLTIVVNDTANAADGLIGWKLTTTNSTGAGTAVNVIAHEFLPTGVTFVGYVGRDGVTVPSSFVGYRFFDSANKQLFFNETFTDTNGNGFYDAGEPYVDANNNHKFDGFAASAVRRIDFPVGDVAGGASTYFSYFTQTTLAAGSTIISYSGAYSGKTTGLGFDAALGFNETCDNLNEPIDGGPRTVKVRVTKPAAFNLPAGVVKSRAELVGDELVGIAVPFEVVGSSGLFLSGIKMDIAIPKGYLISSAQIYDKFNATTPVTIPAPNSAGVRTLSFPIGAMTEGTVNFQVQLDPATKTVLKNAAGEIKAPLKITPTISGGFAKLLNGSVTAMTAVSCLGVLPVRDTSVTTVALPTGGASRGITSATVSSVSSADSKIFVGRCAPATVRRGENFTITIFVGNFTPVPLKTGTISINVPTGCTYVSATNYFFNNSISGLESGVGATSTFKPIVSGSKVSWNIGSILSLEGGAVAVTMKCSDTFLGDRIDDNSCLFDVVNASGKCAGPMSIAVISGNAVTQSAAVTQSISQGMGVDYGLSVRTALTQSFTLGSNSCVISIGGADLLQLNNGTAIIQYGLQNWAMVIGPSALVSAPNNRLVRDGMMRVAVGPTNPATGAISIASIPGQLANVTMTPNDLLASLLNTTSGIVATGGGNIIAAGGGNIVAAGGGNFLGTDAASLTGTNGAALVSQDGSTFTNIKGLADAGGGHIVAAGGGNVVAAGGGNVVAAGGGNILATGAGHVVAAGGGNVVAAGAGNLVSQDGGSIIAAGGGNIIAAGGGNIVATGGGNLLANFK